MQIIDLDLIKAQLRLDDVQADEEQDILELYGDAAEETLAGLLNRGDTVEQMVASLTEQYGQVPKRAVQAALMLVDTSYRERSPVSPVSMSAVPYTFDLLIKPLMRLTTSTD